MAETPSKFQRHYLLNFRPRRFAKAPKTTDCGQFARYGYRKDRMDDSAAYVDFFVNTLNFWGTFSNQPTALFFDGIEL
jgi:hypothetical protein